MRHAPITNIANAGITDPTTRAKIFDWLSNVFDDRAMGPVGGCIKLISEDEGDIRDWPLDPIQEDQVSSVAGIVADQVIQEAEAYCEGAGGGEMSFSVRAFKTGERSHFRKRSLMIALEESKSKRVRASNNKDTMAMLMQQNADMHQVILQQAGQMPKIVEGLRRQIEGHEKVVADNYSLLRANIEDREGREANAFATMERTVMLKEFGGMLIKTLVPAAIQYGGPHFFPLITDWISRPENSQAANKIMNLIAAYASGSTSNGDPNQGHGQG
jgi:hypothetical protein